MAKIVLDKRPPTVELTELTARVRHLLSVHADDVIAVAQLANTHRYLQHAQASLALFERQAAKRNVVIIPIRKEVEQHAN